MRSERVFVTSHGKPLSVLVAKTKDEHRVGASGGFYDYDGMLFEYPYPSTASYWMKGTEIPLTIAWFDTSGRCLGVADMQPLSEEEVVPPGRYSFVLEVPQGSVTFGEGTQLRINHVQRYLDDQPEEEEDEDVEDFQITIEAADELLDDPDGVSVDPGDLVSDHEEPRLESLGASGGPLQERTLPPPHTG